MLDYKDIIIKHYALHMSGRQIASALGVSKSGVNDFLSAFEKCNTLLNTITDEREVKILLEIMEKRIELSRSTIICSQREPESWKSMIMNDEVSSNAIMKRATKHYIVMIQLKGTS